MFCRIEILKRDSKKTVCTSYKFGETLMEIEVFAGQERKTRHADGFRVRDLHTDEVKVVWA